jgi:hypothetical protein
LTIVRATQKKGKVTAKTDANGELLDDAEDYSLLFLMSTCLDFLEEETALQDVGRKLGVAVYITPKFHAEIAAEGIEFSRGIAKGIYRQKPLEMKKQGKEAFKELVKTCLNRNDALNTQLVRKLSRRARAHICAYYCIENKEQSGDDHDNTVMSLSLIEALMKDFKTHRSAIDFDAAFLKAEIVKHTKDTE